MKSTINTTIFQYKIENATFDYLMKLGFEVQFKAVEKVPIRWGILMGSIDVVPERQRMAVRIGSELGYASPVEFGTWASRVPPFDSHTPGMRPRPYLRPALDEVIQNLRGKARRR